MRSIFLFIRRLLADAFDFALYAILAFIALALFTVVTLRLQGLYLFDDAVPIHQIVMNWVLTVCAWLFLSVYSEALLLHKFGATLGKMLFRIKVVADSKTVRYLDLMPALKRSFFKVLMWQGGVLLTLAPPSLLDLVYDPSDFGLTDFDLWFAPYLLVTNIAIVSAALGIFQRRLRSVHDRFAGSVIVGRSEAQCSHSTSTMPLLI